MTSAPLTIHSDLLDCSIEVTTTELTMSLKQSFGKKPLKSRRAVPIVVT